MRYKLCFTLIILLLIIAALPVNAGGFDWVKKLFLREESQLEKQVTKYEGKTSVKQEGKELTKVEQIAKNKELGLRWQDEFVKPTLCAKAKCFEKYEELLRKPSNLDEYIIVGGENTKRFINEKGLLRKNFWGKEVQYSREPDFLRIKEKNGVIEELEIIDAKTNLPGTKTYQINEFNQLCQKAKAKVCNVRFAVPDSVMWKNTAKNIVNLGCILPIEFVNPVIDVLVCMIEIK